MIYISAALYCEAKAFISVLGLKEAFGIRGARVFKNDSFILVITGAGVLTSASALSCVLGELPPERGDIFLNMGICGGRGEGIFICNKISCPALEREYYPHMVYDLGLPERELVTAVKPAASIPEGRLVDMEGAGVFEAVRGRFSPERCFFIKVVSDGGGFEDLSPQGVTELLSPFVEDIVKRLLSLPQPPKGFMLEGELLTESKKLNLSVSQTVILKELLGYYRLKGGDCLRLLKSMPQVKTKAEGREVLEKIRQLVL